MRNQVRSLAALRVTGALLLVSFYSHSIVLGGFELMS